MQLKIDFDKAVKKELDIIYIKSLIKEFKKLKKNINIETLKEDFLQRILKI